MAIRIQLFDGSILEFPDNTPQEVIDRVAKQETLARQPAPVQRVAVAPPPSTERTTGEAFKDIGASVIGGLGSLLQVPGQLAQLVPGLQGVGQALAKPGEFLEEAGEGLKSQGLKVREALRSQAITEAEKEGMLSAFATAITQTIKDPALLSTFITGQLPQLLGPAAAAKVGKAIVLSRSGLEGAELAAQAGKVATRSAIGAGAAMQGADISGDTYKQALEAAKAQGMSDEEANAAALTAARKAFALATPISVASQMLPGGAAIERRLAGVAGAGRLKSGLGEALSEAIEEGGGAFATNVGVLGVDPTRSLTQGVGAAAGLGTIGGGILGGVLGKAPAPELLPGQRPGESDVDFANRLSQEIQAMKEAGKPPAPGPILDTNNLYNLIAQPNGYGLVEKYKQRLLALPNQTPEIKQAIEAASFIQNRSVIEAQQRRTTKPAPESLIQPKGPDAGETITPPSGAGVQVAGEPGAGAAATGSTAPKPAGVVPPVEDVGQPAGGAEAAPAAVAPKIEALSGSETRLILPDGEKRLANWEVIEADSVSAALVEGRAQPRDRQRAASNAQVKSIANNPDFDRLSDTSQTMTYGAPTLTSDYVIVGGNGRFEGINLAYNTEAGQAYKQNLISNAQRLGLDPARVSGMKKPVLIRKISGESAKPEDTRKLAIQSNIVAGLEMSDMERAALDSERMTSLNQLDITDTGDIPLTTKNMGTIRDALKGYTKEELSGMLAADGSLSQSGLRRVKNAVLYKAYGKTDTLSRLLESPDADLKNVGTALMRASGNMSRLMDGIKSNAIPADYDIISDLTGAVETLSALRASGTKVQDFINQSDMFGGGISNEAKTILTFLDQNLRSAKSITEFLNDYANAAVSAEGAGEGLFGEVQLPSKQETIERAAQRPEAERAAAKAQQTIFEQPAGAAVAEGAAKPEGAGRPAEGGEGAVTKKSLVEMRKRYEAGRAAPAPVATPPEPTALDKEIEEKIDQLGKVLKKIMNKFGLKDVALKLIEDMQAEGEYAQSVVRLALDAVNPVQALRHESIHALKELGFFTPQQWAALEKQAKSKWIDQYLKTKNINKEDLEEGQKSRYDAYFQLFEQEAARQGLKGDEAAAYIEAATIEEAIADAFGDFDVNKAPPGMMQAILTRLRNFFDAVKTAFGGEVTAEQVFRKVEKGALKAEAKAEAAPAKPSIRAQDKRGSWYSDATPRQQETLDRWEDERVTGKVSNWQNLDIRPAREDIYDSASAFFYDYEKANGLFDVPITDIGPLSGYDNAKDKARIQNLAEQIKESGEIEPVFVAVDPNGEAYLMEGQHRSRALELLGYKSVPARVIVSMDQEEQAAAKPSLRVMRGEEKPGLTGKVTVDRVGAYFDAQIQKEFGRKLDYNNPQDFERAVQLATKEVQYQIKQKNSGLDWYEDDIKRAFSNTIKVLPELKKEDNRVLFSFIAGIMSPQTNARDNWFIAANAYEHYVNTGTIPGVNPENGNLWQGGTQSANKKVQLEFLNNMVQDMGQKAALKWLMTPHTVKEINSFRSKYGKLSSGIDGKMDDIRPGYLAFGPKVGPFVSNINGIHNVTVDRWMTRTFNRYFGTMIDPDGKIIDAPTEPQRQAIIKLADRVAQDAGIKNYQVQSLLWFYEQKLFTELGANSPSYGFSDGGKKFLESRRKGVTDGDGSAAKPDGGRKLSLRAQQTEAFKRWSGGAPVIALRQEYVFQSGKPVVVEALHGTTNANITEFKKSKANIESDFGAGFYASNTPADVAINYANVEGADLTRRIETLADRIADNEEFEGDMDAAIEEARKRLSQGAPNTMKLYMLFKNPVVLGGKGETFFDYNQSYNEETDEYGEPTGSLVDFVNQLDEIGDGLDIAMRDIERAKQDLMEAGRDNEGLKFSQLAQIVKDRFDSVYDLENGSAANGEVLRQALEGMGFDGIIDTNAYAKFGPRMIRGAYSMIKTEGMAGLDKDTVHFVAFNPTQIKSATGNIGTFDATNPDIRYSLRDKLGMYSELETKIEAGSNKAPAASWKAYINGLTQKGVKPEEIEWSGVRDWLDLQKGTVTKKDLLNYLKQGGVKVDEVVLKDWGLDEDEIDIHGRAAKYNRSPLVLPGGENYREVLLTLPESKPSVSTNGWTATLLRPKSPVTAKPEFEIRDQDGNFVSVIRTVDDSQRAINLAASQLYENKKKSANYRSSHWDQPNVLAHIRVNDRTDADGNKVLFVEEIQSDWGQEGKKKGFVGEMIPQNTVWQAVDTLDTVRTRAEAETKLEELQPFLERNREPGMESRLVIREGDGFFDIVEESRSPTATAPSRYGIPSAPFVATQKFAVFKDNKEVTRTDKDGKEVKQRYDSMEAAEAAAKKVGGETRNLGLQANTEGWLNLALKRIMVMAAEGGYDKVAFVNGEQSADRYDLSKRVDDLRYGDGTLVALQGGQIVLSKEAKPEELPDLIGKEVADRLLKAPEMEGNGYRRLTGLDLKVGGEGMKTFYNTIVPTALKKLLPKVGGGQVSEVGLKNPYRPSWSGSTQAELDANRVKAEAEYSPVLRQPGFDVTPAMREKVQTTGLPRFSLRDVAWNDKRIERLINEFGYTDGRTYGFAAYVNPNDFITSTTPSREAAKQIKDEARKLDTERLERETQTPYLEWDIEKNIIIGHEGRHRMAALADAGVKQAPVVLWVKDRYGYKKPDMYTPRGGVGIAGQKYESGRGGALSASNLVPLSYKYAEQLKERFGGEAGIKYSLRVNIPPSARARVVATTITRQEKGFVERLMEAISPSSYSDFRAQALNRYNQLGVYDKIRAKKMGGAALLADSSAEAAALLSDLGAGLTASALGVHDRMGGIPVFRNGITIISNQNGTIKGPTAIFAPLAGDPSHYQAYQYWAGVKRGSRFLADGREELFNDPNDKVEAEKIRKAFLKEGIDFNAIQKEWIKYNDGLVQYMVDTGVLSKERADIYRKHGDYLPFYRQMTGEKTVGPKVFQAISGVKPPKKLKGGEAPLDDFLEAIVRNTQSAIQAGVKNVAAQRAAKVAMDIGMARPLGYKSSDPLTFEVLENGKAVTYISQDILFVNAIKSLGIPDLPFIGLLSGPANLLRNLVTKDPGFMLANLMRDSMSAWVTSGVKMTPVVNTITNFGAAIAGKDPAFQALMNAGILGGYEFSQNVEQSGREFGKALRKQAGIKSTGIKGAVEMGTKPFTSLWDALEKGTTASDAATRMEVYKRTLAETGNEAEALFKALEVMNFNRKGSSAVVRILTAAVPFLNARMQGLDVLYRAASGQMNAADAAEIQKRFFVRGATIAALSAAYWLLTHDDEEYKKQEQETRDNYWLLPSLGVKIPIPFEIGVLFKVIPERILGYTFGSDTGEDFLKSMARQLTSTLAFNPIPQAVMPIVETTTNFSFFTMRPIVGQGMEGLQPAYQVGPGTTRLAEGLGEMTKGMAKELQVSPMKIDQLISGYTGTMGMYLMNLMDAVYDMTTDSPKPARRFEQMPLIRRFALDPEARGNVTAYYELKNSVDSIVRTSNMLERTMNYEELPGYLMDNMKMLAAKDYILDLEKTMKEFREMKILIRASKMDADAKKDAILSIDQMENQLTSNIQYMKKLAKGG